MATSTSGTRLPEAPGSPVPDPVISLQGVTKRFGSHTVLQDISFEVPRGKITAVLGPSGTGKSVLLKNIIGLLRPEAGQIYIDGEPIVGIRHKDMLRIRRKFGVLFQDGALFGSMDIFDNIAFPLREHTKKDEKEIKALVLEKAEMVGMVAHLSKLPGEISGGMRKRAGLARALILDPDIVFFDEPDSGLDPVRVAYLDELVKSVQHEVGCTFFIITHNIESVKRTADYIGMLYRSSLVRFGPADDMFTSQKALVRQFLAGSSDGPISMDEMVDAARGDEEIRALIDDPGADGDSEPTKPVAARPAQPDTGQPDAAEPEAAPPESAQPESAQPESAAARPPRPDPDPPTERLPAQPSPPVDAAPPVDRARSQTEALVPTEADADGPKARRLAGQRRDSRRRSSRPGSSSRAAPPSRPVEAPPPPPRTEAGPGAVADRVDADELAALDARERQELAEEEARYNAGFNGSEP